MNDPRPEDWWPFRGPAGTPPGDGPPVAAGEPTEVLPPVNEFDAPTELLAPHRTTVVGPVGTWAHHPGHQATPSRPRPAVQAPQQPGPQYEPARYLAAAPHPSASGPGSPQQWAPAHPHHPAPQYPAPQYPAPQYPAPQYPAPQYLVPQYAPPAYGSPYPAAQQPLPNSWAARPAPRPPRRTARTAAVLTLFLVVGIVAGVGLSAYLNRGSDAAPLTRPTVTATNAPSVTGSPSAPPPTRQTPISTYTPFQVPPTKWEALPVPTPSTRAQRIVQANELYSIAMPVATTCPSIPDDIGLNSEFRTISQELLDCQFAAWQPIFEDLDWQLDKPELVTFRDSVSTACGTVSDEQSFYCPASAEIYLSEERFASSQDWWRLHFVNTIVHEFLHHVQASAGILEAAYQIDLREDERTRRVELQAYCMTSRMMLTTPAYQFGADDYRILKQWTTEGGSDTHGSVSSRKHWWLRGFDQVTPAGCNTWVVDADQVT